MNHALPKRSSCNSEITMKFDNPSALQIGHEGVLAQRRYSVVGRVVLGMEENGETYYWNEYHLRDATGRSATLVHEETEDGIAWRLFTLFEPANPLSAADADQVRVGQTLQLDGVELRIELVDESRVYHIEGEPPVGVEIGDVARYFNARSADRMVVVSWSGAEVEHFHGLDLSDAMIAGAFNIPAMVRRSASKEGRKRLLIVAVVGLLALLVLTALVLGGRQRSAARRMTDVSGVRSAATPRIQSERLGSGWSGHLGETEYTVVGQAEIATAQIGGSYSRRDYWLKGLDGTQARLFQGLGSSGRDCFLMEEQKENFGLTPQRAALLRSGSSFEVNGVRLQVDYLFRSTTTNIEGQMQGDDKRDKVLYQFLARSGSIIWIFGWNESGIIVWKGVHIPEEIVRRSLTPGPESKT